MEIKERKPTTQNKNRKRRRKRARAVVLVLSFLVVIALIVWLLANTVLFPIKLIKVSGNKMYTADTIIKESTIDVGDKLFAVSKGKTEKILTTQLPYIKSIKLKRNMRGSVMEIIVQETSDRFCYNINGKFITADYDNKALAQFSSQPDNTTLLKIKGIVKCTPGKTVEIDKKIWDEILKIYDVLNAEKISVNYIDMSNKSHINIMINKQFIVELGTTEDLDSKVAHLCSTVDGIVLKNGKDTTGVIDLSAWTSKNQEAYYEQKNIF